MTRDFAYGETDPLIRKCMLLPWVPADLLDLSYSTPEPPADYYQVWPPASTSGQGLLAWWIPEYSLPSYQVKGRGQCDRELPVGDCSVPPARAGSVYFAKSHLEKPSGQKPLELGSAKGLLNSSSCP